MLAALAMALTGPAAAQRTTSEEVVQCYVQAQNLLEEDKPRQALAIVRACLEKERRTPDERAVLLRFAAQLEMELGNLSQVIKDLEAVAVIHHSPAGPEIYLQLGKLYLAMEPPNFKKSIENLRWYIEQADNLHPDAFYYMALALSQTNRCDEAIPFMQRAIKLIEMADKEDRRYAHSKDETARRKGYSELMLHCCSKLERHCVVTAD